MLWLPRNGDCGDSMNDNATIDDKQFHELLGAAINAMPIDNFCVNMGGKRFGLRSIINELSKQNQEWSTLVARQQSHMQNVHSDLTIAIGSLLHLSKADSNLAQAVQVAIGKMKTIRMQT